jgi:hypothetical protein
MEELTNPTACFNLENIRTSYRKYWNSEESIMQQKIAKQRVSIPYNNSEKFGILTCIIVQCCNIAI